MNNTSIVAVTVGLLWNQEKKVLLCQRPEHKSYPGKWEFPGGKVELGESSIESLRRELQEELGISSGNETLFHTETTSYSDGRNYCVEYFDIPTWQGRLDNKEFAQMAWVAPKQFQEYDILEGNKRICELLVEREKS